MNDEPPPPPKTVGRPAQRPSDDAPEWDEMLLACLSIGSFVLIVLVIVLVTFGWLSEIPIPFRD